MAVALHSIVAIVGLGIPALWPVFALLARDRDPVALHAQRGFLSRAVVNPALLLTLALGIWAAANKHAFSEGYVAWGFVAVVAIGGLEGALVGPGHRKLAAGEGGTLAVRTARADWMITVLVVVTIIVMSVKP